MRGGRTQFTVPVFKFSAALAALVTGVLFASGNVTLQDERTIYTVECHDGIWRGRSCEGRLVVAEQFRFRVLKSRREVSFWVIGTTKLSGKFVDCDIDDGRNWRCQPNADAKHTITLQMSKGDAVAGPTGVVRPFHAIAKWRWFLLRWGVPVGSEADS